MSNLPFWRKEPQSWGLAILIVFLSTFSFATIPLAVKGVQWTGESLHITIWPIAGFKSIAACILMLTFIGPKNFQFKIQTKHQVMAILFRVCVNIGWIAVLSTQMPSGTAVVLFFTYPFWTLLISWLRGDSLTRYDLSGMLASTIGVFACVYSETQSAGLLCILAALVTAILNGSFLFCASEIKPPYDKASAIIWTEIICSLLVFPIFWSKTLPSYSGWSAIISSGLLSGIGMQMLSKAMSKLQSHETSQIMLFQPLATILIGVYVLKEQVSTGVAVGAFLIIGGCVLRFLPSSKKH